MIRPIIAGSIFVAAWLMATPASAASFDCAKAHTAGERTICANRSLNDRDVKMATLYDLVRKLVGMGTRGNIMEEQTRWLGARKACGANVGCIARAYDQRIAAIQKIIDDRVVSNGPF